MALIQEHISGTISVYNHTAKAWETVAQLSDSNVVTASSKRQCCADGAFEIGGVYASTLSMTARLPGMTSFDVRGAKVVLYSQYNDEPKYCIGTFWVTNVTRTGEIFTIDAQDAVGWLDTSSYNDLSNGYAPVGIKLAARMGSSAWKLEQEGGFGGIAPLLTECTNQFIQAQTGVPNLLSWSVYDYETNGRYCNSHIWSDQTNDRPGKWVVTAHDLTVKAMTTENAIDSTTPRDLYKQLAELTFGFIYTRQDGSLSLGQFGMKEYGTAEIGMGEIEYDTCEIADYCIRALRMEANVELEAGEEAHPVTSAVSPDYSKYAYTNFCVETNLLLNWFVKTFTFDQGYNPHTITHAMWDTFYGYTDGGFVHDPIIVRPFSCTVHSTKRFEPGQKIKITYQDLHESKTTVYDSTITSITWKFRGGHTIACGGSDVRAMSDCLRKTKGDKARDKAVTWLRTLSDKSSSGESLKYHLTKVGNMISLVGSDNTVESVEDSDTVTTYTGGNSDYGDIYVDDNHTIFIFNAVGMRTDTNPTSEIFNDYVNNTAAGMYSRASGTGCHASGNWASAGGALCHALGDGSFAYGYGIKTSGYCQTAFGQYNENGNYIFEIGNGASNSERSNAFAVDAQGNIIVQGNVTAAKFIGANATQSQQGLMSAADKTKLDGIEEGANKTVVDTALSSVSTNPVQNKAVHAALKSADAAIANIVNIYGSKNLLKNTAVSQEINGITFTVNKDGSVTANGTASANAIFRINTTLKANTSYIMSGIADVSTSAYNMSLFNKANWNSIASLTAKPEFTIGGSDVSAECRLIVYSGYTAENITFYPMIRCAGIKDDSFSPYVPTNMELAKQVDGSGWKTLAGDVRYRKAGYDVEVRGWYTMPSTSRGPLIGVLPDGYRPSVSNTYEYTPPNGAGTYTLVDTSGNVYLQNGTFDSGTSYYVHARFFVG